MGFFKLSSTILRRPIIINPILRNNFLLRFRKVSRTMSSIGSILVNELPKSEEILQLKDDYVEGNPLKLILQVEGHSTETYGGLLKIMMKI